VISDVSTFDISLNHYADLYGYADFEDGVDGLPGVFSTSDNNGTPKLPNYTLVDASLNYRIPVGDNSLQARLSVYNLFDEFYIEQMFDADPMTPSTYSYKGVNVENSVDIGYGRTYTLGLTYRF
jgi:outer membrane receptor protein involved in Fe transport